MANISHATTDVECPLCEKYRGEPSSVEAHISAKMDEAHKGETGNSYRDELRDVDSATNEATEGSSTEGSDSEDIPEPEVPIPVPSKLDEGDAPESDESDTEMASNDDEGTSSVAVALLVLGGLIAFRIVASRNTSGQRRQGLPPGV